MYADGFINDYCYTVGAGQSGRYSFPLLNYYNTTTCTGTPTETIEVKTAFPCSLVGASGAGSAVDTIISANSYMEFNFVNSAANHKN
jgi:hypothetical protein